MSYNKDILSRFADAYWAWLGRFAPEFQTLFIRWGLVLFAGGVLGALVRFGLASKMRSTLPAQFVAAVLAVVVGLAVPLDGLDRLSGNSLAQLLSLALLGWLFLPFFLPLLLIRTKGIQNLSRIGLYIFELLLILVQWVLMGD